MPWDPKPQPSPQAPITSSAGHGQNGQFAYEAQAPRPATNGARIKTEPVSDDQYGGNANGYSQQSQPLGGAARAAELVGERYGSAASASMNMMQQGGGGLALPGQQQQNAKPQGLQLPQQGRAPTQQQYSQQQPQYTQQQMQQQQAYQQHQQRMQQQQQNQQQRNQQPRIKVETESPQLQQGGFQQQSVNYSQTDGAGDDDALNQWQNMLAERRAGHAAHGHEADLTMREQVMRISEDFQNGLMLPLDEQNSSGKQRRKRKIADAKSTESTTSSGATRIPQLDGDVDDDLKHPVKDEEDEDAINSDLDDSDDENAGQMDNDDDDEGDTILCTYDKVQRVKNKWKCTLKDGVMNVKGKEWVFHKGTGEFEW